MHMHSFTAVELVAGDLVKIKKKSNGMIIEKLIGWEVIYDPHIDNSEVVVACYAVMTDREIMRIYSDELEKVSGAELTNGS